MVDSHEQCQEYNSKDILSERLVLYFLRNFLFNLSSVSRMYKLDKMTPANWILFLTSVLTLIPKNRMQTCNETGIISCKYDHENQKCVCENMDCVPHEQMCFHVESLELTRGTYMYLPSQAFIDYYRLKFLNVSYSAVQEIHRDAFDGLNHLEKLHLKSNKLERIYSGAFDGLSNLTLLNLEDNYLQHLPHGIFYDLKCMTSLFLSRNPLNDGALGYFDQPMPLTLLHLNMIGIESLLPGCFQNLPNLEILWLTGNSLETIATGTFDGLLSLQQLHLSRNKIKTIEDECFRSTENLTQIFLNLNNIVNIQQLMSTLPSNLELLSVYENNITQIHRLQTGELINLKNLDLSLNHITVLYSDSFLGLPSLEKVDLSKNKLKVVDLTFFPQSIKNLVLRENLIENLVLPTTANCLPHLTNLHLTSNKLKTFPVSLLELTPNLNELDINFNPLLCDCYLKDLSSADRINSSILHISSSHCSKSGKPLTDNCIKPVVLMSYDHLDVLQGSMVTLNCSVTGIPHPSVTWIGPTGEELFGKYDYANETTLLDVNDAGTASNGTFMCSARNSEGVSNASINVVVIPQKEDTFPTPYYHTVMATSAHQTQEIQTVLETVTEVESIPTAMEPPLPTDTPSQSKFLTTLVTMITSSTLKDNTKTTSTVSISTSDSIRTTEVSPTRHSTSMNSDQTTESSSSIHVEVSSQISVKETPTPADLPRSSPNTLTTTRNNRLTEKKLTIVSRTLQASLISHQQSSTSTRMEIETTTREKKVETTLPLNISKRSSGEIVLISFLFVIAPVLVVLIIILLKCFIKKVRLKLRKPMNVFLLNDINEELWKDEEISQDGNVCETEIHVALLSNFKDFTYG